MGLNRKTAFVFTGAILVVALCVWIFMIAKIFGGDKKSDKTPKPTDTVEQQKDPDNGKDNPGTDKDKDKKPEGERYQVFRVTAQYDVSMDGDKTPVEKKTYNENGSLLEQIHYVNGEINYRCEYNYNEAGYPVSIVFYDEVGRVTSRTTNEYDSEGNLIHTTLIDGQGQCVNTDDYEYYANGQLKKSFTEYQSPDYGVKTDTALYREDGQKLEAVTVYTSGSISKVYYSYDNLDRILSRKEFLDDTESRRLEYTYEEETVTCFWYQYGFLIQRNVYDNDNNLLETYGYNDKVPVLIQENVYDPEKRLIRKKEYDQQTGNMTFAYEWDFDANGNLLKYTETNADGVTIVLEEYEYDATGRLTAEKVTNRFPDNEIYAVTDYTFLEKGKLLSVFGYNAMGEKINEGHNEYDQFGNLISMSRWYRGEDVMQTAYEYQAFNVLYEFLTDEDLTQLGLEKK